MIESTCPRCGGVARGIGRVGPGGAILCKPCYAAFIAEPKRDGTGTPPGLSLCALCRRHRGGRLVRLVTGDGSRLVCDNGNCRTLAAFRWPEHRLEPAKVRCLPTCPHEVLAPAGN